MVGRVKAPLGWVTPAEMATLMAGLPEADIPVRTAADLLVENLELKNSLGRALEANRKLRADIRILTGACCSVLRELRNKEKIFATKLHEKGNL